MNKALFYIVISIVATNLIRILPMLLIRRRIHNRFIRSFLFYVPYVTLAVMTFPAIAEATSTPIAGCAALFFGIISSWCGLGLFPTSIICCITVFAVELLN